MRFSAPVEMLEWGSRRRRCVLGWDRLVAALPPDPQHLLFVGYRLAFGVCPLDLGGQVAALRQTERPPEPSIPCGNEPSAWYPAGLRAKAGPLPQPPWWPLFEPGSIGEEARFSRRRPAAEQMQRRAAPRDLIDLRVLVGEEELVLEVEDPAAAAIGWRIEKERRMTASGWASAEALF